MRALVSELKLRSNLRPACCCSAPMMRVSLPGSASVPPGESAFASSSEFDDITPRPPPGVDWLLCCKDSRKIREIKELLFPREQILQDILNLNEGRWNGCAIEQWAHRQLQLNGWVARDSIVWIPELEVHVQPSGSSPQKDIRTYPILSYIILS